MKFKTLLFDVDDTLLDFKAAEQQALGALFAEEKLQLTKEIEQRYQQINRALWQDFEQGKIEKQTISATRFRLLFEQLGKSVNGEQLGQKYQRLLSEGHQLLGNSHRILTQLKPHYELYVVTNGIADTQYKRLADSRLRPFFRDVFVSEEVGYQKPMKEYFDYVFERIPAFELEKTIIIGDSLHSDIRGGQAANIQTVWLNPTGLPKNEDIEPTYEIRELEELFAILD